MSYLRSSSSSLFACSSPSFHSEVLEGHFFDAENVDRHLSPASGSLSSHSSRTSNSPPFHSQGFPDSIDFPSVPLLTRSLVSPFRVPSNTVPLSYDNQIRKIISLGHNDELSFDGLAKHWFQKKTSSNRRPQRGHTDDGYRIKQLITIALYTSRWGRLKLQQVIDRIIKAYPRTYGPTGTKGVKWKETIRNKLSYYGMFVKCEPLPGQKENERLVGNHGGYWGLDPYDETTSKSRRLAVKAAALEATTARDGVESLAIVPPRKPKPTSKKIGTQKRRPLPKRHLSFSPPPPVVGLPLPPYCVEAYHSSPSLSMVQDQLYHHLSPEGHWSPDSTYGYQLHVRCESPQPTSRLSQESPFAPEGYDYDANLQCIDPTLLAGSFDEPPRETSHGRQLRTRVSSRKTESPYSR